MAPPQEKIALFIDGANLYATAKTLGFDIDYKRLLSEFKSRGYLLRAFYYTAVIEDQEYSSIKPLIDWLDYNGYRVLINAQIARWWRWYTSLLSKQCTYLSRLPPLDSIQPGVQN